MSLLPSPSLTSRTTSSSAGVRDAQPLRRPLALTAAALRVGDRLLGRQRGTLCPGRFELAGVHRVSKCLHRSVVPGIVDPQTNLTGAVADAVGCAEQPSSFSVTACIADQTCENVENVRKALMGPDAGAAGKGIAGVAFGLLGVTAENLNPGTCRQRHRPVPPLCGSDCIVSPTPRGR